MRCENASPLRCSAPGLAPAGDQTFACAKSLDQKALSKLGAHDLSICLCHGAAPRLFGSNTTARQTAHAPPAVRHRRRLADEAVACRLCPPRCMTMAVCWAELRVFCLRSGAQWCSSRTGEAQRQGLKLCAGLARPVQKTFLW